MLLQVKIIAKVHGKEVLWEELSEELKGHIATTLNNDAMEAAGYKKKQITKAAV